MRPMLGLLSIALLASACSGAGADAESSDDSVEAIVKPTTFVVDATPGDDVKVEADRLVFRADGHEDLLGRHGGDVVACGHGDGFLRRVTGVRREGSSIVVDTSPASLEDAIEQGRVRQHVLSDGAGGLAPQTAGGHPVKLAVGPLHVPLGEGGSIDLDRGEVDYAPELDFDLLLRKGSIERFRVVAGGSTSASMHVRFDLHVPAERAKSGATFSLTGPGEEIAEVPAVHTVVMIGVVPVAVTIKMQLLLDHELEIGGDAQGELDLDLAASLSAGLARQDGQWQTIGSSSFAVQPHGSVRSPSNTVEGDITLTARVAVSFYELAGPYVGLQAYAGIGRDRKPSGDEWYGRLGLRGIAGVEAGLFWKSVAGYRVDAFDKSVKIPLETP